MSSMNFYGQSKREVPIEQPRSKREIAFDQARFDKVWPTCVSILKKQWKSSEKQEVSKLETYITLEQAIQSKEFERAYFIFQNTPFQSHLEVRLLMGKLEYMKGKWNESLYWYQEIDFSNISNIVRNHRTSFLSFEILESLLLKGYCHIREGEEIEAEKVIWIGCRLVEEWVDNDSLSDVQFKLLSDAQLHQRLKLLLSKLFFVHGQLSSRLNMVGKAIRSLRWVLLMSFQKPNPVNMNDYQQARKDLSSLLLRRSSDLDFDPVDLPNSTLFTPHDCVSEGLLLLALYYSKSDENSIQEISNDTSLGFVRRSDCRDGLFEMEKMGIDGELLGLFLNECNRIEDSFAVMKRCFQTTKKAFFGLFATKLAIRLSKFEEGKSIAEESLKCLGKEGLSILESKEDFLFSNHNQKTTNSNSNTTTTSTTKITGETNSNEEKKDLEEKVLLSRLTLFLGICEWKRGGSWSLERNERERKGLELVKKSISIDPIDPTSLAVLSLLLSLFNQPAKALEAIREAVGRGERNWMWNLMSLILSSNGKMDEALSSTLIGTQFISNNIQNHHNTQNPIQLHSNLMLLMIRARLEMEKSNEVEALNTLKFGFRLWRDSHSSVSHLSNLDEVKSRDSSQIESEDTSHSDYGDVKSLAFSIGSEFQGRDSSRSLPSPVVDLWITLSDVFINLEQYEDALKTIKEARKLDSSNVDLSFQETFISELIEQSNLTTTNSTLTNMNTSTSNSISSNDQISSLITRYLNVLALDPFHIETLVRLGQLHHSIGADLEAEKYITKAILMDRSASEKAWSCLGDICTSKGELERASECYLTSCELLPNKPIIPFKKIRIELFI